MAYEENFGNGVDFEVTGFGISVSFSADPTLKLACTSVTPAGVTAADKINITTNETWGMQEFAPGDLGEPQDITLVAAEKLADRDKLTAMINIPQDITLRWKKIGNRSESKTIVWEDAFLMSFEPQEHTYNSMPVVNITIGTKGGSHSGSPSNDYKPQGKLTIGS